jgi:hypothetical protein
MSSTEPDIWWWVCWSRCDPPYPQENVCPPQRRAEQINCAQQGTAQKPCAEVRLAAKTTARPPSPPRSEGRLPPPLSLRPVRRHHPCHCKRLFLSLRTSPQTPPLSLRTSPQAGVAIYATNVTARDCHVASLLAMTGRTAISRTNVMGIRIATSLRSSQ